MSVSVAVTLPRNAAQVGVVRDLVATGLRRFHAPDDVIDELRLVVTEACANVVRHAVGSQDYTVTVELAEGRCSISVSSSGPPFEAPMDPALPAPTAEFGRGLALMAELTDVMRAEHDHELTTLVLLRSW